MRSQTRILTILALTAATMSARAQGISVAEGAAAGSAVYTLEQCRSLALANNKQLMIARQSMDKAHYQNKEAFAAYLPALDFAGGYMYNQKELSIFSKDQLLPIKTFNPVTNSYDFNLVTNPATGQPIKTPDGQYIPSQVALIPKESMTYDIHNVFFGAVTLTQPVYMGGKIVAMNRLTKYAEELAQQMHLSEAENVVYAVDAAYWQVVSLKNKRDLAVAYVNLLDSLDRNVRLMEQQGVATKSDRLSVDVKLNSAQVDLTKVENGLTLSRMALAQVCGLPINAGMCVVDEEVRAGIVEAPGLSATDIDSAYVRRHDLRALSLVIDIAGQQKKVALSSMLPNVALMGTYSFSNPNMFNGFEKRFSGAFSVGVMVKIPLWHWGGDYAKYRAAAVDETVMRLRLDDAREMVNLQVSQASYKAQEAYKTYHTTLTNLESADENLRTATVGFREGVVTSDDVMAAQTAWLKANSENIDAMIDVRLSNTYLSKVLGTMDIGAYSAEK